MFSPAQLSGLDDATVRPTDGLLLDGDELLLADFPRRLQTRFAEHALDLLVPLLWNGQRGSAHRLAIFPAISDRGDLRSGVDREHHHSNAYHEVQP